MNCELIIVQQFQLFIGSWCLFVSIDNESLEELHLAENTNASKETSLLNSDVVETTNAICEVNIENNGLEVADSEDETTREEHPILSGPDASCASSCQRDSFMDRHIQDICQAIISSRNLQLLDLSRNKFSEEAIDAMYAAWSSSRCDVKGSSKHVGKDVVHFFVDGLNCCAIKPCCRRD